MNREVEELKKILEAERCEADCYIDSMKKEIEEIEENSRICKTVLELEIYRLNKVNIKLKAENETLKLKLEECLK